MLTPIDIDNKTFKKAKIGGYDINDVEDFLVKVMEDYETLYKENAELKDKTSAMQESVSYYKSLEEGVNKSIENAYSEADKLKQEAEQQAELIKKEAELNAKQNLEELKVEILKKEAELEEKKKQLQIYKIKVSSMLEAQLKILNEDEE
mgnify:CR=1 FL=1